MHKSSDQPQGFIPLAEVEAEALRSMGFATIRELETERGIFASSKEEIFGCIFGRDSLITSLKLLRSYRKTKNSYLLTLVKKILLNLAELQGRVVNIQNGEEPGKIIHEYRPTGHEHLTKHLAEPWYLHKDDSMRNYDSVDSTLLFLIACYRFHQFSQDQEFFTVIEPAVHEALRWMDIYGDSNQDGFIDYNFPSERKFGGLRIQSWMDSSESLFHEDDSPTPYPIASVEVQAYTYLVWRLWSQHFGPELNTKADTLKTRFNQVFVRPTGHKEDKNFFIASAIDGIGKPLLAIRSSPGHILWASQSLELDGRQDCLLDKKDLSKLVNRLLAPDLFEPRAGIRTLSTSSSHYVATSYHNGSIWPHDNAIIIEGLANFGYQREAEKVRSALARAWQHFGTPIELFTYTPEAGIDAYPAACKKQAWSAASMLAEI